MVLDDAERTRVPGEAVPGRVEVEADEAATCDGLHARVAWKTAGDANEATGGGPPALLGTGEWKAGDRLSFPFSLTVPSGPPTYEGRHFSVIWAVRADADLSWAFDGKAEAPFPVEFRSGERPGLETMEEGGGTALGCAVVSVLALGICLAMLLLSRRSPGIGWWLGAGAGGILSFFTLLWAAGYRRLGRVTLEAGPSPVPRGGELACRIVLRPRKEFAAKAVIAVLTAREKSEKGSGKSRKTRDVELLKRTVELEGLPRVPAGGEGVFAGIVEIPPDAPPTVEAEPHGVAWKLEVTVKSGHLSMDPDYELVVKVV